MRARRAQQSINAPSCHLKKYNAACAKINRRILCAMDKVTRPEHLPEQPEQLPKRLEQLPEQLEQLAEQPKQLLEQPEQLPDKLELQSMMMAVTIGDAISRWHGQRCLSSSWNLACRRMEH